MEPIPPSPAAGWRPLRVDLLPDAGAFELPPRARPRYLLASFLFLVTFFTTTTLGAVWFVMSRTDMTIEVQVLPFPLSLLGPALTPSVVWQVWTDSELRGYGLEFSAPALFILLCHEMGHYLACKRHGVPSTLPYFLPLPFGIGTLGAFIKIRAAIRHKRELFDVGVWGPFAGFLALVPIALIGIARSTPVRVETLSTPTADALELVVPGKNLLLVLAARWFHGELAPGTLLDLHPFALAAWFGFLATAINLLPLGQLDGGHILYATLGARQRRLAWFIWAAILALSVMWPGWGLFALLVLVLTGLRHPPVRDEREPLDRTRRALGFAALTILVLSFMPRPIQGLLVRSDGSLQGVVARVGAAAHRTVHDPPFQARRAAATAASTSAFDTSR